jgi:type II secretory pathway pseudopilin PulG
MIRRRMIADQRGFTMVTVMISMMMLGLFAAAAWAAVNADIPMSRHDQDRKRAYEAAEAGIQWYSYQLQKDSNAWTTCPQGSPQGINRAGNRVSWRTLPASSAQFAVELVPVAGRTCSTSDPSGSMLDEGRLVIRSTGQANGVTRQLVGTFRRKSFLDFMWYTMWESPPPATYASTTDQNNAKTQCNRKRSLRSSFCDNQQWPSGDVVKGPMHTEDESLLICGSPTFGRDPGDRIEIAGATGPGSAFVANGSGCGGGANVKGTLAAPAPTMQPPADNEALANLATITVSGNSCLTFNGASVTISQKRTDWGPTINCSGGTSYALGPNTVIWVAHNGAGCTGGYSSDQQYGNPTSCGDVAVSGTYSTNVTVGAADDIIVVGDLLRQSGSDGMMGLIANQFVRVYHPVNTGCGSNRSYTPIKEIDAAILATNGAFMVDNPRCGAPLGTLKIWGTIGQYWRGTVGTGTATSASTGYLKDYNYDDRLRYRSPPNFLDPKAAAWSVLRQAEQVPVK